MSTRMLWTWLVAGGLVVAALVAGVPALVAGGIGLVAGLSLSGSI